MIRIQVRLTPEQHQALRRLAKQQGESVAELIRQSVDAMLRSSKAIEPVAQREKALAVTGKLHSSIEDLSVQHDRYCAESLIKAERKLAG